MLNSRNKIKIAGAVAVVAIIILAVLAWNALVSILMPIAAALLLSFLLRPMVNYLSKYMPVRAAIIGLYLLAGIIIIFVIVTIIPEIQEQVIQLRDMLPQLQKDLEAFLSKAQNYLDESGIPINISRILGQISGDPNKMASDMIGSLVKNIGKLTYLAVVPVLTYYLLKDGEKLYGAMKTMIAEENRAKYLKVFNMIHRSLWRFVVGQLILSLVVMLATWLALSLAGVRFSLLLGIFMGFMELIPYFGPFIGAIPIAVVAVVDGWSKLLFALLGVIIVQQLEGSFLCPVIIGGHTGLHPAWVIVIILIGGEVFGLIGMIISVPIVMVLKTIVQYVYTDIVRKKSESA